MKTVETPDEELVRRFTTGDKPDEAFRELFRRYGPLTHAFFMRRIGNDDIAAEQNQELFLSVLSGLAGFRGECSFRSWLFSMAHNRMMQLRRRLRVHADERPEEVSPELLEQFGGPDGDAPDRHAVRSQNARLLHRCMTRLSEVERVVVLGQYYHETTLRELTDTLRMDNRSGARASLIKAQRKLRRCMEKAGVTTAKTGGGTS